MLTRTVLDRLRDIAAEVEREVASSSPESLRRRLELLDRIETLSLDPAIDDDPSLTQLVADTRAQLDADNDQAFSAIRSAIQRGDGARALREWIASSTSSPAEDDAYDYVDEIVAGTLQLDDPGPTRVEPTAEMVFYQPTPARHLFDFFDRAALAANDVVIDLGSGLGHVAMLTAICTPARSIGVELEPAYVECAERAARTLNVDRATFIKADARKAPLAEGTVFFLYTPFSGDMLRAMLVLLRREASFRDVRVVTFGPCTTTIAAEDWLRSDEPTRAGRIAIFHSHAR
ncbi:MAG TPA: class I SAM-dependent methyltransferase [Gemmatimonadaceae bacterium]|jgi:hypothetical protein